MPIFFAKSIAASVLADLEIRMGMRERHAFVTIPLDIRPLITRMVLVKSMPLRHALEVMRSKLGFGRCILEVAKTLMTSFST